LLGIPVFYADTRAKCLMATDKVLINDIKGAFGNDIYNKDGILERKRLASIVFNDDLLLEKLNSLVHPAVFRDFAVWATMQKAPFVLKEAAILFESGSDGDCDYTIVVTSPRMLRISRVMSRDNVSAEEVEKRMDKQLNDDEKIRLADFVLLNDERQLLIPQVLSLHKQLLGLNDHKG
ncbi:MAG TPA: dephospho-CoA kinase, partial [Pedobacter sp.]